MMAYWRLLFIVVGLWSWVSFAYAEESDWIVQSYHNSLKFEKAHRYDKAIKALMKLHKQYARGYLVNLRLGWLNYLKNDYASSLRHYSTAAKVLPNAIEPRLGLTRVYMVQQQYKQAVAQARKIIKQDYLNYYANLYLTRALNKSNSYKIAMKVALKMLSIYPADKYYLNELGLSYVHQKKYASAISCFTSVVILDPSNVTAKKNLASLRE